MFGKSGKLSPRFVGPFEVLDRVSLVAYRLAFPPQLSCVHDVFHVFMLCKYEPDPSHVIFFEPLAIRYNLSYVERPIRIIDCKEQVLRNTVIHFVHVQWRHHLPEESTTECGSQDLKEISGVIHLGMCGPFFVLNLEDQFL